MDEYLSFYIGGEWIRPVGRPALDVINPATEEAFARIALGTAEDVDQAVGAAQRTFASYSLTSRQERLDLLESILAVYTRRADEMADAISREMGAPLGLHGRPKWAPGTGTSRRASPCSRRWNSRRS